MPSCYSCAIPNPTHGFQSPGISMDTRRSGLDRFPECREHGNPEQRVGLAWVFELFQRIRGWKLLINPLASR